jgi:iron(III) transport system substrate-binding protein
MPSGGGWRYAWCVSVVREAKWKVREGYDRWRALPLRTRVAIALGSLAFSGLCLVVTGWLFLRKGSAAHDGTTNGRVVLYTSADAPIAGPIIAEFERLKGMKVSVVTDTEATKTTGLVERLLAERASPRADVWWSNEALGTVALAEAGVLEPYASRSEGEMGGRWPAHLRAPDRTWYGFAQRARVIAYASNRVTAQAAPTKLRDLTRAQWAGKVGMARPQFGTTRTHVAALVALHGVEQTREFLSALRDNGLRLYDGNAAVVQGIAFGEIDAGLTDSDDVLTAKRNGWSVEMVYEVPDRPGGRPPGLPSAGPVVIPNTVAVVRTCPHPNEARQLADFLLSAKVEQMLAESESGNVPVRESLARTLGITPIPDPAPVTAAEMGQWLEQADRLIAEVFPL